MHRLPHKAPVKFVESILQSEEFDARTALRFPYTPTLPMIAEAAAQSAVFVRVSEIKKALGIPENETASGMLLKIKSTLHLQTPPRECEMQVHYVSNLDNFFVMRYELFGGEELLADGELNIFFGGEIMSRPLEEGIYRVLEHDGTRIVVELSDASHPVFRAHFENNPILPGFMQIDIIAALMKKRVHTISMAKFMKPVLPGTTLIYTVAEGEKAIRIRVQGQAGESFSDIKLLWDDL